MGCQRKQKKSIDQRAPQIGYEGIKSFRSLAMKNYLVTGRLLSLVESYNNSQYVIGQVMPVSLIHKLSLYSELGNITKWWLKFSCRVLLLLVLIMD